MIIGNCVTRKKNSILVPVESWMYLKERQYRERTGKELSEKSREVSLRDFNRFNKNGMKQLLDGDCGGCNGPVENAFEERRWTSWSANDMKRILDEANLPYEDGPVTDCIDL